MQDLLLKDKRQVAKQYIKPGLVPVIMVHVDSHMPSSERPCTIPLTTLVSEAWGLGELFLHSVLNPLVPAGAWPWSPPIRVAGRPWALVPSRPRGSLACVRRPSTARHPRPDRHSPFSGCRKHRQPTHVRQLSGKCGGNQKGSDVTPRLAAVDSKLLTRPSSQCCWPSPRTGSAGSFVRFRSI